jgi:hypothetical protein
MYNTWKNTYIIHVFVSIIHVNMIMHANTYGMHTNTCIIHGQTYELHANAYIIH